MPERLLVPFLSKAPTKTFKSLNFFPQEPRGRGNSSPASLAIVFILRRYHIAVNSQEREGSEAKKGHERLGWYTIDML